MVKFEYLKFQRRKKSINILTLNRNNNIYLFKMNNGNCLMWYCLIFQFKYSQGYVCFFLVTFEELYFTTLNKYFYLRQQDSGFKNLLDAVHFNLPYSYAKKAGNLSILRKSSKSYQNCVKSYFSDLKILKNAKFVKVLLSFRLCLLFILCWVYVLLMTS